MKARKKPVEIEYLAFTRENHKAILKWSTPERPIDIATPRCIDGKATAMITTLEGKYKATEGEDVIIKGVEGEVYPCKVSIFKQTYDLQAYDADVLEEPKQTEPTKLEGKSVIQKFANWLAIKDGQEMFEITASDKAIVIRRVE